MGLLAHGAEARRLSNSVKPLGSDASVQAVHALAAGDLQGSMSITFSLAMRNLDELQARINGGQNLANGKLTQAEMDSRYLPLASDYDAARTWLAAAGFSVDDTDANHTSILVHGSVALIQKTLSVDFARVTTAEGTFVSAMGAPLLPAGLPAAVTAVAGLQPHHRARHHRAHFVPSIVSVTGAIYLAPSDLRAAYGVPSGAGGGSQTIAIIMDATVLASDVTTFWTSAGLTSRAITGLTMIPINGGPPAVMAAEAVQEATLDVDYTSGVATAANIRLYAVPALTTPNISAALTRIIADHASVSSISVLSMSFGEVEYGFAASEITTLSQQFAQLSALGITTVAASGDAGSNPDPTGTLQYVGSDTTSAMYPASDPNVLGVGGTNLTFNSNFLYSSEATWSEIPSSPTTGATYLATGGGLSTLFPHQSWQADGHSVLAKYTTQRCVPDVAAISVGTYLNQAISVFTIVNGTPGGEQGTSLAAPVWAAMAAMVNEARANALVPQPVVGFMNPMLYTYANSGIFTDITSGNNGAYSAAVGYDLTTGLGTPAMASLLGVLAGTGPSITIQPANYATEATQTGIFIVTATGSPAPTYQWQRMAAGTSTWVNLIDNSQSYRGTATNSLYVFLPTLAMNNDQFQCVIANSLGSVTTNVVTLTVVPYVNPFPTAPTSSGGGGAVSTWFLGALAALAGARRWTRRRRLAA